MQLIHYRGTVPNFGDDMNIDLWRALMPGLIDDDPQNGFVGIGTIIGRPVPPVAKLHVFSSGVGNDPVDAWRQRDVTYWCVRGPISAHALGLSSNIALTDGAVLTPLAAGFPDKAVDGGKTLVIPHWQTLEEPGWAEAAAKAGFDLLDPRGVPQSVIATISRATMVLTESLHGAILADTYGIPWIAFACSGNFNTAKWVDWCESVGVTFGYTPVPPPSAKTLLRFGRGRRSWGSRVAVSVAEEHAAARTLLSPPAAPHRIRQFIKSRILSHSLVQPLLGFSIDRTAEALRALARTETTLSLDTTRSRLQDRMMSSLRNVALHGRTG